MVSRTLDLSALSMNELIRLLAKIELLILINDIANNKEVLNENK
jgi:hypothetical protein